MRPGPRQQTSVFRSSGGGRLASHSDAWLFGRVRQASGEATERLDDRQPTVFCSGESDVERVELAGGFVPVDVDGADPG
jgi:hypothetical protein